MKSKLLVALLLISLIEEGRTVVDLKGTTNGCVTLSIPEEELRNIKQVTKNMNTFLERNLEKGHQNINKVLETYGASNDAILKVDPEAPLASLLLQHQIAMHNSMKEMFFEIKRMLGQTVASNSILKSQNEPYPLNTSSKVEGKTKLSPLGSRLTSFYGRAETYQSTDSAFRPSDCSEVLVAGHKRSGVYQIYPFRCRCSPPVEVYCDMDTKGGGWTVILSRMNMSKPINFTRNWESYKNGFGTAGEEYWLGNEHLHTLTINREYIMRMEMSDNTGRSNWGEWNVFKVASEETKYRLSISTPNTKSTAYDRMAYFNANYFSTYDADNDKQASINCASKHRGGWWYNACMQINPMGVPDRQDDAGMKISPWSKTDKITRYASHITMKIRLKMCSQAIPIASLNTHNCVFG